MNTLTALQWRYAVNTFSSQRLTDQQIALLIESTRLAPSAFGLQPLKLIVISDQQLKEKLLPYSYGQEKVVQCSHLLVLAHYVGDPQTLVDNYFKQYCKENNKEAHQILSYRQQVSKFVNSMDHAAFDKWSSEQAYIALGTLLTAAAFNQIDSCPMTGFEQQQYDDILALNNSNFKTTVICPVGLRAKSDKYANNAKVRNSLEQFADMR
ncbi:nitroreductase family protein [Thalassotalea sp. 1_MG-2023]|uniref:nitroreductase family protein n=1 Tax=Thalassotalea sp. 1_MG-2023 TaxID=3062680 RepID=UPI0026E28FF3|nr:nitroreductase family protein [Thalassotalea sp. 1_MG-2023]MDO6428801.1 nitroreductase family protein [Thalassotalea sp. 1_MG-2023]